MKISIKLRYTTVAVNKKFLFRLRFSVLKKNLNSVWFRNGTVIMHHIIGAPFAQLLNAVLYVCTSVDLANCTKALLCSVLMLAVLHDTKADL